MKRSTKQKLAALAFVNVAVVGWIGITANGPGETKYVYVAPSPVVNTEPYMAKTVPCGEYDNKITPCHRKTKDGWELILSWAPYRAIPLNQCAAEDGGKLPCIWPEYNAKDKKSDPITRNVFWRGKL